MLVRTHKFYYYIVYMRSLCDVKSSTQSRLVCVTIVTTLIIGYYQQKVELRLTGKGDQMSAFIGSFFFLGIMLAVNFGISWWNARTVGKMWSESKAIGGFPRVLAVCGYIMAISGFTFVYVTILMLLVANFGHYFGLEPYIAEQLVSFVGDLSYVMIIMAVLPTGIIIWINSLIMFWRRKSLRTGGMALWNTFAMVSNTIGAVRNMPSALNGIRRVLSNNSRGSGNIVVLGILLVLAALLGGFFTASAIMHRQDKKYDFVEKVTGRSLAS